MQRDGRRSYAVKIRRRGPVPPELHPLHKAADGLQSLPTAIPSGQQLLLIKEEAEPELQPSLDQEEPKRSHIREEQEELWTRNDGKQLQGMEEADIHMFRFTPVPVKSEEDEEKPEDCGGAEPARNSVQHSHLQSDTLSSETEDSDDWQEPLSASEPASEDSDDDDDDDWKETRDTKPASKTLKSNEVHESDTRCDPSKKSFSCSECGRSLGRKSDLQRHMRIHTGEKPFCCDVCGKRFTQHSSMKLHMAVHTNEKPFGCDVCGKRFTLPENKKQHMRVHSGEKPFGCGVCGKKIHNVEL